MACRRQQRGPHESRRGLAREVERVLRILAMAPQLQLQASKFLKHALICNRLGSIYIRELDREPFRISPKKWNNIALYVMLTFSLIEELYKRNRDQSARVYPVLSALSTCAYSS